MAKAMRISMSVKPRPDAGRLRFSITDRDSAGDPVDDDVVLPIVQEDAHASARGGPVRKEADVTRAHVDLLFGSSEKADTQVAAELHRIAGRSRAEQAIVQ